MVERLITNASRTEELESMVSFGGVEGDGAGDGMGAAAGGAFPQLPGILSSHYVLHSAK